MLLSSCHLLSTTTTIFLLTVFSPCVDFLYSLRTTRLTCFMTNFYHVKS
jgi:hypothetical protein